MDNHLSVGLGFENMPLAQEESAQLTKVVDFSVENDPDSAILIRERLVATAKIDDREPHVTESHLRRQVHPLIIRASMAYGIHHCSDQSGLYAGGLVKNQLSTNSTHVDSVAALRPQFISRLFLIRRGASVAECANN